MSPFLHIGQFAVIGQFVTHADVGVSTDIHRENGRLHFEESERTTLVNVGFSKIYVPFCRLALLAVLLHSNHEL